MILHAVGCGNHQNGVVGKGQSALGLGGKVHVAGGVQKDDIAGLGGEARLLGEDGDAPFSFHGVVVQIGGAVVYATAGAEPARQVQKGFGEGGLARIHVGEDADGELFLHARGSFPV